MKEKIELMKFIRQIIVTAIVVGVFTNVNAALPVAVDGQPLPTLAPVLERVQKSVVSITSDIQRKAKNSRFENDSFFNQFFDRPQNFRSQRQRMAAVGVVVDASNGYILTNEHSIAGASNISVTFSDGDQVPAQLIGVDKVTDVAIIQVSKANLTQIEIGNSDVLRVGDFVVSVGDPLGSQSTITSGLISALSKKSSLKRHQYFIQSDAGYGPGILINLRGEMIGLNISRVAQTAGSTRIGFSTPINKAMKIKQQILEYGVPQRGFLAVQAQDLTPELANVLNVEESRGAVITRVAPDSSAEKSGLQVGDVVLKVDDQIVRKTKDLRKLVTYHFAGDQLEIDVLRNGVNKRLLAVLESSSQPSRLGNMVHDKLDGATFKEVSGDQTGISGYQGVLATNVRKGSVAWNNGVRTNDLIVSANRKEVSNLDEFRSAINNKDVLMLNIVRENGALFLLLQ